ncbi:MAG: trigger factor [Halothiobacillus sp. 28-55-5]|nr:MAG: trigger factor [Halothiobacillus sp. 28-55-5]
MQVELQSSEGLLRRLAIQIPGNEIDVEVERRIKDMSRRVRLDGFRPGKAPLPVVRQRYLAPVRDEVVGDVMSRAYQAAVVEQKLRPAGNPVIESVTGQPGENLNFVAAIEVYPEFEIGDLTALAIETISGEAFQGGTGEGMQVVLGEKRMLADFEAGLDGIAVGEAARVFDVAFPDDYPVENLKGKTAQFTVTATAIEEKALPVLDDEFAGRFGSASLAELQADVRKNMARELKQALKRQVKDAVLTVVTDSLTFDVPKALVDEEAVSMRDNFVRTQMPNADASALDASLFNEQAAKRVKMGLVIMEIVKSADLKVDDAEVEAFIQEVAAAYDEPAQVVATYKGDREMMSNARTVVLEQQSVDYVLAKAQVSVKPLSFKAVMNPQA